MQLVFQHMGSTPPAQSHDYNQGRIYWHVQGGAIFHDKGKNIRNKIRYTNLSTNMMIQQLQCEQK